MIRSHTLALKMPSAALLAGLLTLLSARPAAAHALGAEAKLKGDKVEVAAFFDDDTPAIGARVAVQDKAGKSVAEGKTDDRGQWTFPRPSAGKYRLTVDAGAGHRASLTLTVPASGTGTSASAENTTCDCCEARDEPISGGPTREEFTRTPWGRVGLGLAIIAAIAGAWVLGRRRLPA